MIGGDYLKNKYKVTSAELEVLKVVWKLEEATFNQISQELCKKTNWKRNTIQTLISRLVNKGTLIADKVNKKSYIYYANINEKDYKMSENLSFINRLYNGSLNLMLSTFIEDNQISNDDLTKLKDLLNSKNKG